jgi:cytochrome c oxidase subunit 4
MADHGHDHEHAHTSQLGYLGVLLVLFAGTVITWLARDIGHAQHWSLGFSAFVALAIATTKACFVVYFFMHVRESAVLIKITAVSGFLFLSLLFIFIFGDYVSRREIPTMGASWEPRDARYAPDAQPLSGPDKSGRFGSFSVMAHAEPPAEAKPAEPAPAASPAPAQP